MQAELNPKKKIEVINTVAIPAVTYSFNIVNWNLDKMNGQKETKVIGLKQNVP